MSCNVLLGRPVEALRDGSALQFMGSPRTRARYWARSFAGWHTFSSIQPNDAHISMARLQQRGWIDNVVTQVHYLSMEKMDAGTLGIISLVSEKRGCEWTICQNHGRIGPCECTVGLADGSECL